MTVVERLLDKITVLPASGCWEWTGARNRSGYGCIRVGESTRLAHRVAYEFWAGPIPDGLELDHLCGTRSCVNPDHLEAVDHVENVKRGRAGEPQASRTHCPSGHEYTPDNTYRSRRGRHCRACGREHQRKKRERRATR